MVVYDLFESECIHWQLAVSASVYLYVSDARCKIDIPQLERKQMPEQRKC